MLRKAIAGFLSAILIGAVSLVPSLATTASAALDTPTAKNTLVGNYANTTYGFSADFGSVGGNSGGAWWGNAESLFKAQHSGTVTAIQAYANCGTYGAGTGGVCATDPLYLAIYVNGSVPSGGSCNQAYPGSTPGWFGCTLTTPVTVTANQFYYISASVSEAAGGQNMHFSLGKDAANSSGTNVTCGNSGSATSPYGTPPSPINASTDAHCSAGATSINAFAATGSFNDSNTALPPAIGLSSSDAIGGHQESVATHVVQFYRFTQVPGNDLSNLSGIVSFYADLTTTSTSWSGAIYDDESDTPTERVATCNGGQQGNAFIPALKGQWNSCTVSPINVTPGQSYWIGIWNADPTNALVVDDTSNGSVNTECYQSAALTTPFAATFNTTGATHCNYKFGNVSAGPNGVE